jgi:hypothetical protein
MSSYNQNACNNVAVQETRKIIFIAHSLGGLVTADAIYIFSGSADKHIQQVGTCTTAIAFLGIPHFGSDYAG